MLQAALNGARTDDEHPAIPRTPHEIAEAAAGAVREGAQALHLHAYDEDRRETLEPGPCAAVLRAVRAACPGIRISLTTSAEIEPDPERRLQLVGAWTELPDIVSANQGEAGIEELCDLLQARGVGIEAGLLTTADAQAFVARPQLVARAVRALVEPLDADPRVAVADGAEIEQVLADAAVTLPQLHHGDAIATWAVMRRGVERGHGIRVGLEDTVVMPDGTLAPDNAALVAEAARLQAG